MECHDKEWRNRLSLISAIPALGAENRSFISFQFLDRDLNTIFKAFSTYGLNLIKLCETVLRGSWGEALRVSGASFPIHPAVFISFYGNFHFI